MKPVSDVAEAFGDETPQKFGQRFVREGLPAEWKPRLLSGGPRERNGSQLFVSHSVQLERFSYPAPGADLGESYRKIREDLIHWLEGFKSVEVSHSGGHLSAESGRWTFFYASDDHDGTLVVWIVPRASGSALLLAHLTETSRDP